jgi:hypothetical protein
LVGKWFTGFDLDFTYSSAWGLAEFEGDGQERKPVAVAEASRDLTN